MSLGAKDPPRRTSAYASTILGLTSLAGYWRLGDASGTTAVDAKGTQNGTYTEDAGATAPELAQPGLVTGDAGTSVFFPRTSPNLASYVDISIVAGLETLNGTIEAWLKVNGNPASLASLPILYGSDYYFLFLDSSGVLTANEPTLGIDHLNVLPPSTLFSTTACPPTSSTFLSSIATSRPFWYMPL